MRILIANKFARVTGGADRHCLDLAAGLRGRGHEVVFLSTASSVNLEHAGSFVKCSVSHSSRDSLPPRERVAVASRAVWNTDAAHASRELVESFRPDVVHAHKLYPQLSVAPLVVAARAGIPVVQTLHDYEFLSASPLDHHGGLRDRDEGRLEYRLLNSTLLGIRRLVHVPRVRAWLAVSSYLARVYTERGISASVLPNFTLPAPSASILGHDARRGILFLGRLTNEKGVLDVIETAEKLPEVPFLVAGDGPLRESVEAAAARLANLRFLGRIDADEAHRRLSDARLLLMPSRWQEPGPLGAVEAMAAGTPIVGFRRGGLGEYVEGAGAGVVIEPGIDDLAEVCGRIYVNPDEWSQYSNAGLDATQRQHSMTRCLERLESVYEGMLQ